MELLERVRATAPRALVLTAPAGYGKSTLVRAYAAGFERVAWCDCEGLRGAEDFGRRVVDALVRADPALGVEVAAARLAEGSVSGPVDALWARTARRALFVFENADGLRGVAAFELLGRLIRAAPAERVLAFCARRPQPVALARALGSARVLRLSAFELALDEEQIAVLAAAQGVGPREAALVAQLSNGWPIVARLLLRSAAEGGLQGLRESLDDIAFDELYDYLAEQVIAVVPAPVLEALTILAAIPDATEGDLRAVLGADAAPALRGLLELPFVQHGDDGALVLHPLVARLLAVRRPQVVAALRERVLRAHEQHGDWLRVVRVAAATGAPERAARALEALPTFLDEALPLPESEAVVAALARSAVTAYPNLWIATIPYRRFAVEVATYLAEARTVYHCLPAAASARQRVAALIPLVSALYQHGAFEEVEELFAEALDDFAREPGPERASVLTLKAALRGEQARFSEAEALQREAARLREVPFLSDRALESIDAYRALLRGRPERGFAILDEILRRMRGLPLYVAYSAGGAALYAWAYGDDERFARYVGLLEEGLTPGIERGFVSLLAAARGTGASGDPRYEVPSVRAIAHLFRMGGAPSAEAAAAAARDAAAAADICRDPYLQVLAHAAELLLAPERGAAARAALREVAARIESDPMRAAVEALLAGAAEPGLLAPYVVRRVAPARGASATARTGLAVELATATVREGERRLRLSEKELELVLYLACSRATLTREQIGEALWPHIEDEDAQANNLRVTVSRLRKKLADERAILFVDGGYRLAPSAAVDLRDAERLIRSSRVPLEPAQRAALAAYYRGAQELPVRYVRFGWFAPVELRLREARLQAGALLAHDAIARGAFAEATAYAQALVDADPLDEDARAVLVRSLLAAGERAAALRAYRTYAALLRAELDLEPSPALTRLLSEAGR